MIPPVIVSVATAGIGDAERAFATLGQRIAQFEKQAQRDSERSSRQRTKTTDDERKNREREYKKLFDQLADQEKLATRTAEREGRQRSTSAARETKAGADTEIAERKRVERETERSEERMLAIRRRSLEQAGRLVARQVDDEIRQRERASRTWAQRGRQVGGVVNGSVGRLAGGAFSLASTAASIGGGFIVADAVRQQLSAERTAALLVNAGTNNGVSPGTAQQALSQASVQSQATGIDKGTLLQGALTYSQNARGGDFAGALANMGFFGKMAQVTGVDVNDIAQAAGTLQSQNPELNDPKQMQQLLLNTLGQAHQGSMSMVDAAKQFGILGATRAYYKGDVAQNQQTLIGLGQIARAGGDVGEAGTFVKDIATEAQVANRKFRKRYGHDLLHIDPTTGQLDAPEQVVEQVMRSTHGNIAQIGEAFGQRGSRLFGELASTYRAASDEAAGGAAGVEAGIAATMANVRSVTGAGMTTQQFDQQFQESMSTPAAKLEVAWNKVLNVLEDKAEPYLEIFANELPGLVTKLDSVVHGVGVVADYFIKNPFSGIGAVVLAAITKDLVSVGLGEAVKALIARAFAGIPAPVGGVGGGGAGLVGAAAVVSTAAAAFAAKTAIDLDVATRTDQNKRGVANAIGGVNVASALMGQVRSGTVSPADIAAAQETAKSLSKEADEKRKSADSAGGWDPWSGVVYSGDRKKNAEQEAKNAADALKFLTDAIKKATSAVDANASANRAAMPPPGAPGVPIANRPGGGA